MARTRRSFTGEFKREAVRLAEQPDNNVVTIAQDLEIDSSVLRRWVTEMRGGTWEPITGRRWDRMQHE
jgi:transposase